MKNKHKILTIIVSILICLIVIYINLLSHEKTQKIYLEQTKTSIIRLKKDFLSDTVNNTILEIDRLRESKYSSYKKNTESRLKRFQEETTLNNENFIKIFKNRFEEDINTKMWTALLWDDKSGEILYDSTELKDKDIENLKKNLKENLASYVEIKKENIRGIFGVSKFYIDELVKKEIGEAIRNRQYANGSYIWINEVINYEGGENYAIRKIHPNLIDSEGNYLSTDMEDIKGNLPYLEELEGINENREIFFTYFFKKLKSDDIVEKITYAKHYEDYDWIIAMGVDLDDINAYTEEANDKIKALSRRSIISFLRYLFILLMIGFITLYLIERNHLSKSTQSLEDEVNIDTLTDASSRRSGEKNLNKLFKEYKLKGPNPAIMMMDIDDFKDINDKHGHEVGDVTLIEIVKIINHTIRSSDQLIRWGGDEFVGIFPGLREEHLSEFAKKILDEVSSLNIPIGEENISITISIGLSYFKETDDDINDVLKRIDKAMYKSKEEGKNRFNILL